MVVSGAAFRHGHLKRSEHCGGAASWAISEESISNGVGFMVVSRVVVAVVAAERRMVRHS